MSRLSGLTDLGLATALANAIRADQANTTVEALTEIDLRNRTIESSDDVRSTWVLLVSSEGCCCSEAYAGVALFSDRGKAQAIIDEWDAAVRRAEADGIPGICHVGDFEIADEIAVNPERAIEFTDEHLYLRRYLT